MDTEFENHKELVGSENNPDVVAGGQDPESEEPEPTPRPTLLG